MKFKLQWRSNKPKGIVEPVTLQSSLSLSSPCIGPGNNFMTDWSIAKVVLFGANGKLEKENVNKMGVTGIIQLLNFAIPQVANLIVTIRHRDGTQSAVVYLDEADAQFAANQKQIQDWMAARGQVAQTQGTPSVTVAK